MHSIVNCLFIIILLQDIRVRSDAAEEPAAAAKNVMMIIIEIKRGLYFSV